MTVDISAEVTRVWPATEAVLTAGGVDYATHKASAIAKAKRALYGASTPPSDEGDIPDQAGYWIADQAVVYLIPLAKDYYMLNRRVSDSKENATLTYYNLVAALDKLKTELEASLAANRAEAEDAISGDDDDETGLPAVSVAGLMVDPVEQAFQRGPWMGGQTTVW